MAFTTNTFTLATGFTPADVLTKLGEVLADMGVMGSATGWHDSFTDTSGSEVRVVAQFFSAATRGTVYHAFTTKSSFDGLWYTMYYDWDVATHQSQGVQHYDYPSSYEHPDDISPSSWGSFYTKIDSFADAGDITFTTFTNSGSFNWCRLTRPGSTPRLFGFPVASSLVLRSPYSYESVGPLGMWGVSDRNISMTQVLRASIWCGDLMSSTSSSQWMASTSMNGLEDAGSLSHGGLFSDDAINATTDSGVYEYGASLSGGYDSGTSYQILRSYPLAPATFDGCNTGDLGVAVGFNDNTWTPADGDTLVVSPGVEEYLVHRSRFLNASLSSQGANWSAMILRTV